MSDATFRLAAKAFIRKGNKFLLLREADSRSTEVGKYQIPGGGLEHGEKIEQALIREVKEETNLNIRPITPFHIDEWQANINGSLRQIVAIFYLCEYKSGKVRLSNEHDIFAWVSFEELKSYPVSHPVPLLFKRYSQLSGKNWDEL